MTDLKKIYEGRFKDRVKRFDDGGSAYSSYTNDPELSPISTGWATQYQDPVPLSQSIANATGASSPSNGGINSYGVNNGIDATSIGAPPQATTVGIEGGSNSASSSASGGALGTLLKALGLGNGNSTGAGISALAGLLSAAGAYKQNQAYAPSYNPPALFGGAAGTAGTGSAGASNGVQFGPNGGYGYQNYAGASGAGLGYAPRSQMAPVIPNYYTYGQGPQASFFTGSQGASQTPSATNMAKGGRVSTPQRFMVGGMPSANKGMPKIHPLGMPTLPSATGAPIANIGAMAKPARPAMPPIRRAEGGATLLPGMRSGQDTASWLAGVRKAGRPAGVPPQVGPTPGAGASNYAAGGEAHGALAAAMPSRHVKGPGDGTSDSIPARLATGEYVQDAHTVSMLGNGDNDAGAKILDKFRENIRKHKGAALARGKMPPDAKDPMEYLPKGAK